MNFHSKGKFNKFNKAASCKTADQAQTLSQCESTPVDITGVGDRVVKVPVVVAHEQIQVDIESVDRLPKPAREIKRIRKNVHLTQCKVVQSGLTGNVKLFLAGFVRKNIEFVTSCSGAIEHHTVEVPFSCVVPLTTTNFEDQLSSIKNGVVDILFNDKKGMGMDMKERGILTVENFNEKPFCELEQAFITELDISEDWKPGCNVFRTLREKIILDLELKVLQVQQVFVPPLAP
ncbi:CsxC family protein [Alkalihalobacillus sp. BA299]|uniref:CsxC family protein n=1 Tax=Alkalihalobacillus sp. BA299 TaxID=2815938 RepID=UPI001ADD38A1|nr:hypothetical protein [Alkalihalobacillus sp. BA299]